MARTEHRTDTASEFPTTFTLVAVVTGALAGFVIGSTGPIAVVAIGAGIVAGPTLGGLVFILAIAVGILCAVLGLIAFFARFDGAPFATGFLACLALVIGAFGGTTFGSSAHIGGWAERPRPTLTPTWSFGPAPIVSKASGEIVLTLEGADVRDPELPPYADGVFSHWCYSAPDAEVVSTITALDVGHVPAGIVYANLWFSDPSGLFTAADLPRVELRVTDERGFVFGTWVGPATATESLRTHGLLAFTDLPAQGDVGASGLPTTLSGSLTWRCGAWGPWP